MWLGSEASVLFWVNRGPHSLAPWSPGGPFPVPGKCRGQKVMNSGHEPMGIHQWAPKPRVDATEPERSPRQPWVLSDGCWPCCVI